MRCVFLLPVLLFLTSPSAASQRQIEILVVSNDQPVAGAEVWVRHFLPSEEVTPLAGPFVSNENGKARVTVENHGIYLKVYGKDKQGRIGLAQLGLKSPHAEDMRLHLGSPLVLEGKIKSQGKPVAGVKCKLLEFQSRFTGGSPLPCESILSDLESISDENGIIRFKNIPPNTDAIFRFQPDSFAWGTGLLFHNKSNSFEMMEHGELEFKFQNVSQKIDENLAIDEKMIRWAVRQDNRGSEAKNFSRNYTQIDGINYEFPIKPLKNIASGHYKLMLNPLPICPYIFENLPDSIDVQRGKKTTLEISVRPAAAIEGRFLDRTTGKGIAGLGFAVVRYDGTYPKHDERYDGRSNEKGEFRIYVKRGGSYQLFFGGYGMASPSHISPLRESAEDRIINQIKVTDGGTSKLPDLKLAEAIEVSGQMEERDEIQEQNQGAVYEIFSDARFKVDQSKVKSEGKFKVFSFLPDSPAAIYIRHGNAVNIPESKKPDQYPSPSSFAVSEKHAIRVSGVVLDQQAKAVRNAQVSCYLKDQGDRIGSGLEGRYLGTVVTAEDGKYEFGALWPNVDYQFVVYCPEFEPFRPFDQYVKGRPGQVLKDVKLTLTKKEAKNLCRGKLVGVDGKPIEGGTVAAAGKSWLAKDVLSEKDGGFAIDCISAGPVILVAKHKEFRQAFVLADPEGDEAIIVMKRLSDLTPSKPVLSTKDLEARKRMAAEITDRYWDMELNPIQRGMLLRSIQVVDPTRAKKLVEKLSEKDKKDLLISQEFKDSRERILQLAREDVDLALVESRRLPRGREAILCQAADTFLAEKKYEISRKFAAEVAKSTLEPGQDLGPFGGLQLAKAGELAWKSGDKENGEKWIRQGAEIAVKNEGRTNYKKIYSELAEYMAVLEWKDMDGFLKKCREESKFNDALVAYLMKRSDYGHNEIIDKINYLKKRDVESYAKSIITLAKRSASKDLTEALNLAKEVDSTRFYGQALIEVALEIHRKDPQTAYRLVDQAFDFLEAGSKYGIFERSTSFGGRPVLGAQMVFFANKMGYPETPTLVARTLGCLKDFDSQQKEEWNYIAKRLAFALAFSDPATAKLIVERFLPKEDLLTNWFNRNRLDGFVFSLIEPEKTRLEFTKNMGKKWTMDRLNHAGMLEWTRAFQKPEGLMEGLTESIPLMWLSIDRN